MGFLRSLLGIDPQPIKSNSEFWNWFQQHEQKFYKVLKGKGNIQSDFLNKLGPKLDELKEGYWFLAGMYDDDTAELILTADGAIKNIVFVEELVADAPKIHNWKITALKQPTDLGQYGIEMDGYRFDEKKISFHPTDHTSMPDEIDITITHEDLTDDNMAIITNGVYIALENYLGELNSVTAIDTLNIISPKDTGTELIPIQKLHDYLIWREKEFVEKYQGSRHNTENDNYSGLEATLSNGNPLYAIINVDLLKWDRKPSHPWIAVMEIKYDGKDNNGMPDKSTYELLNTIEDRIMQELKDSDGYLNVGRQTADSVREIYFACVDFRKPSKVLDKIKEEYQNTLKLHFDIYKDKYWQTFKRFEPSQG